DAARVHPGRAVPREEAVDGNGRADLERITPPAAPLQLMGRSELGPPVRDLARLGVANVEVDPDVRIRPLDLRHDALERNRLVRIELRGERVVGESVARQDKHGREQTRYHPSSHAIPSCFRSRGESTT